MRELYEGANRELKYDDKVPDGLLQSWKELIAEAVLSDSLCFPRCVRPAGAIGTPIVVGFADGAKPAFAGNIYLQWQVPCKHGQKECELDYDANLLWGKARVTPITGFSTPRSEMSSMVMLSRMALTTVKALQTESSMLPKGVIMMVDSECTI